MDIEVCLTDGTNFTETGPPMTTEWTSMVSNVESFAGTLIAPRLSIPSSPPRESHVSQDSLSCLTGQWPLPYSPTSMNTPSVLGGASTSSTTVSPPPMSTTVVFCTKPVSGSLIRYGT